MMDKVRSEFESRFPVPLGVYWQDGAEQYEPNCPEFEPDADAYHAQYQVWQAATEAARGGVEPVAWLVENTFTGAETLYRSEAKARDHRCVAVEISTHDTAKRVTPLYTQPPAPVVPEKMTPGRLFSDKYCMGWNDCVDSISGDHDE